jgi:hypothetical protein
VPLYFVKSNKYGPTKKEYTMKNIVNKLLIVLALICTTTVAADVDVDTKAWTGYLPYFLLPCSLQTHENCEKSVSCVLAGGECLSLPGTFDCNDGVTSCATKTCAGSENPGCAEEVNAKVETHRTIVGSGVVGHPCSCLKKQESAESDEDRKDL